MDKVSRLSDRKNKILVPIDSKNGYLAREETLRLFSIGDKNHMSLGDGSAGSHNTFIKALVADYVNLYRKLENLNEL